MRRPVLVAGGVVALGAFLLTGAAMLRWYAAPRAALLPRAPDVTVTLTGGGTAYDAAAGGPRTGPLTERVAIRGGGGPPGVAVWTVDRRLLRADGVPLRLEDERVALDRRTAAAVTCCGERPAHTGLSYAFPPGLRRADQPLFDPATERTALARYTGEEQIAGLRTYRFEQSLPETDLRPGTRPGAAAFTAGTTGRVLAASERRLWVEPASGVVVRVEERRQERLVLPAAEAVTLLDVRLVTDDASVRRLAALATDRRARLAVLGTVAPLVLAAAGALALLLAGVGYRIVTMPPETRS